MENTRSSADEILDGEPIIGFATAHEFERWLEKRPSSPSGLWLKIAKKDSGATSVSYAEALDIALCYGWIDGQKKTYNKTYFLQRFTPRRGRSIWSKANRGKALALIESGRMRPAGLAAIEAAKTNGQWDAAYAGASAIKVPSDLTAALEKSPGAKAFFATLRGTNRYAILYRLETAKKPETRAKRVERFVEMLEKGETIHPK